MEQIPTFEELESVNVLDIDKYINKKYPHLRTYFYTCVDHKYTIIIIKNKDDCIELCPSGHCHKGICDDIYFTGFNVKSYFTSQLAEYLDNVNIVQICHYFKYE
jgi:hypothetical protein